MSLLNGWQHWWRSRWTHARPRSDASVRSASVFHAVDGFSGRPASGSEEQQQLMGVAEGSPKGRLCCGILWTRRRLVICSLVVLGLVISTVLLIIFVAAPKIAQASIDSAVMSLSATTISTPTNTSVQLHGTGSVTNAGFLDATIAFPDPVTVSWTNRDNGAPDLALGTLMLPSISVSGATPKSGSILLDSMLTITSPENMGLFSASLVLQPSFSWILTGTATAQALGLSFGNLNVAKVVTLNGFAGLKNVTVKSFTPSAGDNNSLNVLVETEIFNPSTISIEMGDLFFDFTLGTGLGAMTATNVTMNSGENDLTMNGNVVVPGMAGNVSQSISSLGLGSVVTLNVQGNHVVSKSGYVGWLNQAIKALSLNVTMNLTAIAQQSITSAELSLSATSISQAQESSFHITASGMATNAGAIDATLTFPDPIQVYWTSRPNNATDILLGTMNMSPLSVGGTAPKSAIINLDTSFAVADPTVMGEFASFMIQGSSFSWLLVGSAMAQAFGLSFPGLSLSKVVTLSGFNSLPNPSVSAFNLPDSDSSGIHVVTTAAANNPSSITIDMGSVGFNMMYNGTAIGSLQASNVVIAPGMNSLNLDGRMYTTNSDLLSRLFSTFLNGNGLAVSVVGNSVTTSTNTQPSWLNKAFQSLSLAISLPSPALSQPIVSGLAMPSMTISFNPQDSTGNTVSVTAPVVTANFKSPYAFNINVQQVQTSIEFYDKTSGVSFASITVPLSAASLNAAGTVVTTAISGQSLSAISGQEALFASFFKQITLNSNTNVGVKGSVSSVVKTDACPSTVTISGLPLDDTMSFSGLQGLTAVSLTSSAVVGGDATNGLHMQVGTSINNPSTITLQLNADVTLNVFANGNQIGTVKLANFALAPNANSFSADAFLNTNTNNAAATSALQSAMSSYLGGSPTSLTLQGSAASIPYASLQPAFAALAISTTLAGQTSKLLVSGKMVPDLTSTSILATTIVVSNPLAAPITIQKITASVLFGNTKIGSIDFALDTPTTVAAGGSSTTEKIPLNLVISTTDLIALLGTGLKLLSGNLNVNIASTIQNALGSFDNTIQYNQNNVPIAFALA